MIRIESYRKQPGLHPVHVYIRSCRPAVAPQGDRLESGIPPERTARSQQLQRKSSREGILQAIINEGRVIYNGTVDQLLQEAEGRVFTMTASKRELPELKRQLSITSMHTQGNPGPTRRWVRQQSALWDC